MARLFLLLFLFFFPLIFFPSRVYGSEQFAEKYSVFYEVLENGETLVSEKVTTRNLSNEYFGTNYTSVIPTTDISEVVANDGYRDLATVVKKENQNTSIQVTFPTQVIGLGKEYSWTLSYKTRDFAQKHGTVWQFAVPKIAEIKNLEQYDVTLSVPTTFGDPSQTIPNPSVDREVGSSFEYVFRKDQLIHSGISMFFGTQQVFDYTLHYTLENKRLLPQVKSIILPGSHAFQDVTIQTIDPKPENVLIDRDRNTVAYFHLAAGEKMLVSVRGSVKLDLDRQLTELPDADKLQHYLEPTNIWDVNSPQVQEALKIAFENSTPITTEQKLQLIYEYVTTSIQFGTYQETEHFANNSASSILNNPKERFCQDFVNVFIALSRAAQIPAQQVVGLAYSQNSNIRPVCFTDKQLHTWVRVYDIQKGWISIDPTWGATTSGGDFLRFFDLSHIQLGVMSDEKMNSFFPTSREFSFSENEFLPNYQITPKILGNDEYIAGFPFTITFRIENGGNTTIPAGSAVFSGDALDLYGQTDSNIGGEKNHSFAGVASREIESFYPSIPPFGYVDFNFRAKSAFAWDLFDDRLQIRVQDQVASKTIHIKPLFQYTLFSVIVFSITGCMFGLYILALVLHYKTPFQLVEKIEDVLPKVANKKKQKVRKKKKKRVKSA